MTRRLLCVTALAVACASGGGGAAAPASRPATSAPPAPGAPGSPGSSRTDAIRYGPSALRYEVHRRVRIEQDLNSQRQLPDTQQLGARVFVSAAITGPADSVGYPATYTVDSIVPDSGTPQLVAQSVSRARRLVFSGRLTARGEFVNAVPSDSIVAQSIIQLVGNFRDFLPRIPATGVTPGATWTDTVETTQRAGGSEISRRAVIQATATWDHRADARTVRLDATTSYRLAGGGQNAGQAFELSGAGEGTAVAFIAADGRYLGGESRDSATLTIRLPVQGVAIPVTQVTRTTVAVLP